MEKEDMEKALRGVSHQDLMYISHECNTCRNIVNIPVPGKIIPNPDKFVIGIDYVYCQCCYTGYRAYVRLPTIDYDSNGEIPEGKNLDDTLCRLRYFFVIEKITGDEGSVYRDDIYDWIGKNRLKFYIRCRCGDTPFLRLRLRAEDTSDTKCSCGRRYTLEYSPEKIQKFIIREMVYDYAPKYSIEPYF